MPVVRPKLTRLRPRTRTLPWQVQPNTPVRCMNLRPFTAARIVALDLLCSGHACEREGARARQRKRSTRCVQLTHGKNALCELTDHGFTRLGGGGPIRTLVGLGVALEARPVALQENMRAVAVQSRGSSQQPYRLTTLLKAAARRCILLRPYTAALVTQFVRGTSAASKRSGYRALPGSRALPARQGFPLAWPLLNELKAV